MPTLRVLVVALALAPLAALANLAASRPVPAVAGNLEAPGTALAVTAETLAITCVEEARAPVCTFRAAYTVENPEAEPQAAVAAFSGVRTDDVHIERDGAAVDRELTDAERARLSPGSSRSGPAELSRRGVALELAPGASTQLVVTGRIHPGRYFVASYATSPVETRHRLLGSPVPRSTTFDLDYLVAPLRSWARQPRVAVSLTVPAAWTTRLHVLATGDAREVQPPVEHQGDVAVSRFELDGARDEELQVSLELPKPGFFNGGVLLGVGGAFGGGTRLRLRGGYEVAAPHWWLYSLVAETDARRELLVVPAVEVATPSVMVVIPSAGAGLGVPVRVLPDVRVGVRVQASLHWPFLGLVAALDLFPGTADAVQFGLLAQLGL